MAADVAAFSIKGKLALVAKPDTIRYNLFVVASGEPELYPVRTSPSGLSC